MQIVLGPSMAALSVVAIIQAPVEGLTVPGIVMATVGLAFAALSGWGLLQQRRDD